MTTTTPKGWEEIACPVPGCPGRVSRPIGTESVCGPNGHEIPAKQPAAEEPRLPGAVEPPEPWPEPALRGPC